MEPNTYPFIVQTRHREYVQAPNVRVQYRELRRVKRTLGTAGGFTFREVEKAGVDRKHITVIPTAWDDATNTHRMPLLRANGRHAQQGQHAGPQPSTAAGLKRLVRRLRPQEAAEIAALDGRIAALEAQIVEVREQRKATVAKAWTNGHVVRWNEVEPEPGKEWRRI